VLAAIADLKARGLKVTIYPLVLMDIPQGNGLVDPYGGSEQSAYPWRGRITCSPAPGQPGSPEGSGAAAAQVAAFVPGYRAMVLHYAQLAVEAGGVDAMLIGSEMVGLSGVRGAGNSFPLVDALVALAADVRAVVGPATKLTYAADWSEYSGCQKDGAKFFHLDPLWASPDIDAVGIDCYMPLADWRGGESHADLALARTGYELDYLAGNIAGGEGYDWFYASQADRRAQLRTPITDGAHGEPWIWRYKDIEAFWGQQHHDRPGGVRNAFPTAWVPGSKPIWLTEIGCGAVDKGANQPNIFGDSKSAEDGRPYFSAGTPDALIQRQVLRAHHRRWNDPSLNPAGMVDSERLYCWTWDARPFPVFPALTEVWSDGTNHPTGHWLTGRLGGLASDELAHTVASEFGSLVLAAPSAPLIGGLTVSGAGTARDVLETLFDLTGQKLAARGDAMVGIAQGAGQAFELEYDALASTDAPVLSRRRGDSAEKPAWLTLGYFDRERDYLAATSAAIRPDQGPLVTQSMPVVLDTSAARQAAERLLDQHASGGDRVEFALPPGLIGLEPGDRVTLPDLAEGPFEITEIRDGAVRQVSASAVRRGDALATGVDRPRGNRPAVTPVISPVVVAAQLPPLPSDPLRSRLVLGAYADPWPGVVEIVDNATGTQLARLSRPAAIGELLTPLASGPEAHWDRGSALDIKLIAGHLADAEPLAALAGTNRVAVETDAGDWKVIGFANAELVALGQYRLTTLLRGLEGSGHAIGTASTGRRVLVLNQTVVTLAVETDWIGESRDLRATVAGGGTGEIVKVAPSAGPVLPLPPVHLKGARAADGSIALEWIRRSRADGDGWGVAEPPLEFAPENWQVEIVTGGVTVRTLSTAQCSAPYPLADQIADLGAPASGFTFNVQQVSAALGAGHGATGEFHG
jgi:hypothetical protein